jgi:hypothetical protein
MKKTAFAVLLLAGCLLSAVAWGQGETPRDTASALGLDYPIQVKSVGNCLDGGSLLVELADGRTNRVRFFENHSLGTKTPGQRSLSLTGKAEDAKVLSAQDGERVLHQITTLLVDWVNREFPEEEQARLTRLEHLRRARSGPDEDPEYRKWRGDLDSAAKSLPLEDRMATMLKPRWAMYILTHYMPKEDKN